VSIDKTPVDLWLQVASTQLFGFNSVALRLPEVLAGILTIPLLYDIVRRLFGHMQGVVAALALAVIPISVVTARSDTMDSMMLLLILAAAWLAIRSAESGRASLLVTAGAVMGLAFNVKLFEALIALPAMIVLAVLISAKPWRRRSAELVLAAGAFVAVSLAWLIAVSLAPGPKPYPIGSTNGSVWNVVFTFNGLDRIRGKASPGQQALDPAGPLRLFASHGVLHGQLIGSALVAALILGGAALAYTGRRLLRDGHPAVSFADHRFAWAGTAWLGTWLLLGVVFFSKMERLHPRYLEAFTPAVAGVLAISLVTLARGARRDWIAGAILGASVLAVAVLGASVARAGATTGAIALGAALVTLAVAGAARPLAGRAPQTLAITGAVAVLAVPTASALHLGRTGWSSAGAPGAASPAQVERLSRYLRAHQGSARYEVASNKVAKAGPLVVHDGRPVLMLTSLFNQPLITAHQLSNHVAARDVRYVMLGNGVCSPMLACPPVLRWALTHGTDVSRAAHLPARTLYRLGLHRTR
jgi:4-amino-4-deoxy-L-arabinose transferase-like glycosyltransferase